MLAATTFEIGSITSALALIAAVVQLHFLKRQMKAQHDWNRRVTALNFAFTHDQNFREIRSRLYKHLNLGKRTPGEINLDEIQKRAASDYPEVEIDLPSILDRLEAMAVAIKNGVADEEVCRGMLLGIAVNYYRFFAQYIEDLRSTRKDPLIYEHLETLARKWSDKPFTPRQPTG